MPPSESEQPGAGAPARYLSSPPQEMDAEQREVYDAIAGGPRKDQSVLVPFADDDGRLIGPFALMPISPRLGDRVQELGSSVRFDSALDNEERELAILTVAAHLRSGFEWFAHEQAARAAGIDDRSLAAVRDGREPRGLSARSRLVWRTTRELVQHEHLNDGMFESARDGLGERGLIDLVWLCGYYRMLAMALAAFRPQLPPAAAEVFAVAPRDD